MNEAGFAKAGSLIWFVRHEGLLAWRDFLYMLTAGTRWRLGSAVFVLVLVIAFLHFVAYGMVATQAGVTLDAGPAAYTSITGGILLSALLMLSQALEQVTRLFYGRGDLDLLKSAPASLRRVFAARIFAIAASTTMMAMVVVAPVVDVLLVLGGWRWLAAFGVAAAAGLMVAGLALVLTVLLFETLGPKRTRLASQIVAAIVGSVFLIGIQVWAIFSIGATANLVTLDASLIIDLAPARDSLVWIPARAVLGDNWAFLAVVTVGAVSLILPTFLFSGRLGTYAVATAGIEAGEKGRRNAALKFGNAAPRHLLRRKEWILLLRDPWLASQSLLQLLYLIPPALLLWRYYGGDGSGGGGGSLIVLAPVLTVAAGQLGGGLAWLAVSGEDAPDLIASAPLAARKILGAKIESVLAAVFAIFLPFLLGLAGSSLQLALIATLGVGLAALSSTLVQIWFRGQAKRRYFRRRQTSSRIATFAEAFSSVAWAAASTLAVSGSWFALGPALVALLVLLGAWVVSPSRQGP